MKNVSFEFLESELLEAVVEEKEGIWHVDEKIIVGIQFDDNYCRVFCIFIDNPDKIFDLAVIEKEVLTVASFTTSIFLDYIIIKVKDILNKSIKCAGCKDTLDSDKIKNGFICETCQAIRNKTKKEADELLKTIK